MLSFCNLSEEESTQFAYNFARVVNHGVIFLDGNLGAGKTFFCRNLIFALGYTGKVKSPTFTLVEHYCSNNINIYHCDLYRLTDPLELEFIGVLDDLNANNLCLIEWANNGQGMLPAADLTLRIDIIQDKRDYFLSSSSQLGKQFLTKLHRLANNFYHV